MSWLLPTVALPPAGKVRNVGEADEKALDSARRRRWYLRRGRALLRAKRQEPEVRARYNGYKNRWMKSAEGRAWRKKWRKAYDAAWRASRSPEWRAKRAAIARAKRAASKALLIQVISK